MSEILDIAAALSRLLKAENVLLICHKNPDGDIIIIDTILEVCQKQ